MTILLVAALIMASLTLAMRAVMGQMDPFWVGLEIVTILGSGTLLVLTRNER